MGKLSSLKISYKKPNNRNFHSLFINIQLYADYWAPYNKGVPRTYGTPNVVLQLYVCFIDNCGKQILCLQVLL